MAKLIRAVVIGISESILEDFALTPEIQINGYDLLRWDRNGHGVACYIRNDLNYNIKSYFPKDIENIFFEILFPNTKLILVGTIYSPPSQINFSEIFNQNLSKVDTNNVETYIFGGFTGNLWHNWQLCFQKPQLVVIHVSPK